MPTTRVTLYDRLPEIYRIRDESQTPPGQLKAYLAAMEGACSAVHENIESLYHDLFIETCDDWVIPYIGDLLGTSHLSGEAWTLRADVADTISLRRRKGTINAIELLSFDLTGWSAHCVELRERMVWNHHLNHQRPDEGGKPPYGMPTMNLHTVIRGGTMTLRDPAMLSLLNTPFDPFCHLADLRPPGYQDLRYNLPNLAVFLWRLKDYRLAVSKPFSRGVTDLSATATAGEAAFVVRFDAHPLGRPIQLFNKASYDPDRQPPVVTLIDQVPGPIPMARLTTPGDHRFLAGAPEKYVVVETYDHTDPSLSTLDVSDHGLQFHLPEVPFGGRTWTFRGANLCAWESGLHPPLKDGEIAIDPRIGRFVVGVSTSEEGNGLTDRLLLTCTYGAVGPVGSHPVSVPPAPAEWNDEPFVVTTVDFHADPDSLRKALDTIATEASPVIIEIADSMTHELDLASVIGTVVEDGGPNLLLNRTLIIRAADDQRPVINLARPLRFRPLKVRGVDAKEQKKFDAIMDHLTVRLEGLYLTRGKTFPAGEPLIARAALNSLEIIRCTLDPGGNRQLDGNRAAIHDSLVLQKPYGFAAQDEKDAFNQTPEIIIQRSITGPLFMTNTGYRLALTDSIIDAGSGVDTTPSTAAFAVSGSSAAPATSWGPATQVSGITVFGRMRIESVAGRGGIWAQSLEALDNQKGCIKFSYFAATSNRLPQWHACFFGSEALLALSSECFGDPAYGRLAHTSDFRIRERGPGDDAMGAFGFLLEAHAWRNLTIRFREFMPLGVRPLVIPVT